MISLQKLFVLLTYTIVLGAATIFPDLQEYRNSRSLLPFAIKSVPAEPCSPADSSQMEGVCMTSERCNASGGEAIGECHQGIGTCCKFSRQCLANLRAVTVLETVENLMNSNHAGACEFVFPKQPGISQIRLDFINAMLQEPYTTGPDVGNCQSESLKVIGAANLNGPLKVCGRLTGQHSKTKMNHSQIKIDLVLWLNIEPNQPNHSIRYIYQNYNIRATQIPCDSADKAPDDCLHYFTTPTAAVKSFGFPRQLNNQRYTICVKPTSSGSALSWRSCSEGDTLSDPFKVSERSQPCLTDWVIIDGEKRCGQTFPPLMTAEIGSDLRIRVNFDERENGDDTFTVDLLSTDDVDRPIECANILHPQGEQVFPSTYYRQLCMYNVDTNTCQCRFSNMPDSLARTLSLYNIPGYVDTPCPIIQGYTASPGMVMSGECRYFENIRVTDSNNTGFCLRYQTV